MELNELYKIDESYYYVYEHWLNNEIIYVGKGKGKRIFNITHRNELWHNIVENNYHKIKVIIKGYFEKESDALDYEKMLIYKYSYEGKKLANIDYNLHHDVHYSHEPISKDSQSIRQNVILEKANIFHNNQIYETIKRELNQDTTNKFVIFSRNSNRLFETLDRIEGTSVFRLSLIPHKSDKKNKNDQAIMDLKRGIIPDPYNILIYPIELVNISDIQIKDERVKTVFINEVIENKCLILNKINQNINTLLYKTRRIKNETPKIRVNIPKKYLNVPLTTDVRNKMCKELNIVNSEGIVSSWRFIKKLLSNEYSIYDVRDHVKMFNGKRKRVSTITVKNQ